MIFYMIYDMQYDIYDIIPHDMQHVLYNMQYCRTEHNRQARPRAGPEGSALARSPCTPSKPRPFAPSTDIVILQDV